MDERLRACCTRAGQDPASLSVVLVGHGSARAPGRAAALRRHAEGLEEAGGWAGVAAAFLEEPPLLPDALAGLRGGAVAVVGFLAGEGGHARHDVPALIRAERARRGSAGPPVFDLGPVGDADAMPRIILDQVARAAAG
jgi:sirohydrochlorin ferrochelatase